MRRQPHHLISGLIGGYLPNRVEHYDSKVEATSALVDLKREIEDDVAATPVHDHHGNLDWPKGSATRDGFFSFHDGYEYAEIVPCPDSEACDELETDW